MTYSGSALRLHRRGMLVPLVTALLGAAAPAEAQDPYQQLGIQPPSPPGYPTIAPPPQPAIDDHSYSSQSIGGGYRFQKQLPRVRERLLRGNSARIEPLAERLRMRAGDPQLSRLFRALSPAAQALVEKEGLTQPERIELADDINVALMSVDVRTGVRRGPGGALDQFLRNAEARALVSFLEPTDVDAPIPPRSKSRILDAGRSNIPFASIVILGGELLSGETTLASAPQVGYSSNRLSADVGVRPYFGKKLGYGISVSHELTRYEVAQAQAQIRESFIKDLTHLESSDLRAPVGGFSAEQQIEDYVKLHNHLVTGPRISLHGGYVHLIQASQRLSAGTTVGLLQPLGEGDHSARRAGLFGALTLQGVDLDQDNRRSYSGARVAVRVGYQDAVPFLYHTGAAPRLNELYSHRWRWQFGLEYVPVDVGPNSHPVALFVRRRFGGHAKGNSTSEVLDKSTEVGLSVGRTSDGNVFVSLRASRFFGW